MPMNRVTVAPGDNWKLLASAKTGVSIDNLTTNGVSILALAAGSPPPAGALAAGDAGTPRRNGDMFAGNYRRVGTAPQDIYARCLESANAVLAVDELDDRTAITVGGQTRKIAATFNRPNDTAAYASGDLIANSVSAGTVVPMAFAVCAPGGSGQILRTRVRKSTATVGATFRVHLYRSVPVPQGGDNAAWLTSGAFAYLGALDVTMDRAFTDGAAGNGVPLTGSVINFDFSGSSGTTLYGLLEARSSYTPGISETFEVDLEIMRD